MRIAAKIDNNQPAIVQAFRQLGARVQVLSHVGHGFPDLLILFRGKLALVEIKDGSAVPSARRLTRDEQRWHDEWNEAPLHIIASIDEVAMLLNRWEAGNCPMSADIQRTLLDALETERDEWGNGAELTNAMLWVEAQRR